MSMIQAQGNVSDGSFCFLWDAEGNPLQFSESAISRPGVDAERSPA